MKINLTRITLLLLILTNTHCVAHKKGPEKEVDKQSAKKQKEFLYVGTSSQRGSQGLYVYEFDRKSYSFTLVQTMPEINRPVFLDLHPSQGYLFSVNLAKDAGGNNQDMVSSYAINPENGKLTFTDHKRTYGGGACHVSLDKEGKWIFISHFRTGEMSVLPFKSNGEIGDTIQFFTFEGKSITAKQESSHVHSILVSPDNKFVYVADMGTDKIMIYSLNPVTGKLTPASLPYFTSKPGSGPRHFIFNVSGSMIYVADEISSTVSVLTRNASDGSLELIQTISTLPAGFIETNTVADIHTDPTGKFLYVSNRGHNSLAIFKVEPNGTLKSIGHESTRGDHPRNFMVDPKGEFVMVANQFTDNVFLFRLDKVSGLLNYSGISLNIPSASCLKWFEM